MTRLERRYRALLGVLPRDYRAEREEEMVGTFLATRRGDPDLDGEYGWPGWSETAATLALAVRVRLGGSVGLIAALGLVFGVAVAAASAVSPGSQPLWTLAHLASAGALIAAARGARVETAVLAGVPVAVGVLAIAVGAAGGAPWEPVLAAALLLPSVVTLLALVVDTPPSGTRWLWAGAGAAAVGATLPLAGLDPVTLAPAALAAAALFVPRWTVLVLAAALLPYAALSAALPGGPVPWPLLGFAATAITLTWRGVRLPRRA
ncbi:hypothetical protein ACFPM7_13460 [Actinokineospora guangxiensis]|uniref:Membrane protein DUF2157 n=1 Tax=Actinokineospora guangxiensis TaxID=1490288 RepID=A0ABW0EPI2_9PSEU